MLIFNGVSEAYRWHAIKEKTVSTIMGYFSISQAICRLDNSYQAKRLLAKCGFNFFSETNNLKLMMECNL